MSRHLVLRCAFAAGAGDYPVARVHPEPGDDGRRDRGDPRPSRAVIPAARVKATHRETNVERTATADGAGRFLIASLSPGTYQLTAGAPGFADRILDDLSIALGSVVELEITLQIAGIDATVIVPEPSLRVDARRTVMSEVVSPQQIEGLPTNGRDFIAFS